MDEQLEFLQLVVARLDAAQIPYMLTGSLALAIHALPRMTRDIDLVIGASDPSPAARAQLAALFDRLHGKQFSNAERAAILSR